MIRKRLRVIPVAFLVIPLAFLAATLSLAFPTLDINVADAEESVVTARVADSDKRSANARIGHRAAENMPVAPAGLDQRPG